MENTHKIEIKIIKNLSNWIIPVTIFLVPIFFMPVLLDLYAAKIALFVTLGVVSLLTYLAFLLREGEARVPKAPFLLALFGVAVASLLSAIFTGAFTKSFGGYELEVNSSFFWILGSLFAIVAALSISSMKQIYNSTVALISSAGLIVIALLIKILSVYGVLPVSLTSFLPDSLAVTLIDALIILGAATIAAFNILSISIPQKSIKIGLWVLMVFTLLLAGAMNFKPVIFALAFFAFIHFVYTIVMVREKTEAASVHSKPLASIVVLIVSVLLLLGGSSFSGFLSNVLRIGSFDVRPTISTTADLTLSAWKANPIFGTGPNKFSNIWNSNKPTGVNLTNFWATDFNSGFGFLPTTALETGILGLLAILCFLGLFVWGGFTSIFTSFENPAKRFILMSLFFVSTYFWIMALVYSPSIAVLALAFLETGIFAAAISIAGNKDKKIIKLFSSSRANFISIFIVVVLMVTSVAGGYFAFKKVIAFSFFNQALTLVNAGGSVESGLSLLSRAYTTAPSDLYARAISRVYALELQSMITTLSAKENISDEEKTRIQTIVGNAVAASRQAIALDKENYQNFVSLGSVYEMLSQINVEGSVAAAEEAYKEASRLAPQSPTVPLAEARLALIQNDSVKALAFIDTAISLKQNFTDAYFLKAQIEVAQNNIPGAIKSVEDATLVDPQNAGLYFQLGILKYNVKDFRGAGIAFENAIKIVPEYANAKYFLGLSYDELGMKNDATMVFEDLEKSNPDNAEIKSILENLKANKSAFAEASLIDEAPENRATPPIEEN